MRTRGRLLHAAPDRAARFGCQRRLDHPVERDAVVPEFEGTAFRILLHPVAIHRDGRHHEARRRAATEPHVPRGDHEARREALQIPFPRAERDFIEVVQIEDELPFRRGEAAEVHQMAVAANRHDDAGVLHLAEIVRLKDRTAAKERERRHRHAPVPERHEPGDTAFAAAAQQLDRIALQVADGAMTRPFRVFPRRPAGGFPFCDGAGLHAFSVFRIAMNRSAPAMSGSRTRSAPTGCRRRFGLRKTTGLRGCRGIRHRLPCIRSRDERGRKGPERGLCATSRTGRRMRNGFRFGSCHAIRQQRTAILLMVV